MTGFVGPMPGRPDGDLAAIAQPGEGRALAALGLEPADIERLSLERIRRLAPAPLPSPPADVVALRMAYAAGDASLLGDVEVDPAAVEAIASALRRGAPVACDVAMLKAAVRGSAARLGCDVLCAVEAAGEPLPPLLSAGTRRAAGASTRTARGLLSLTPRLGGAVVAIGNAPTAVLALLDALADGAPRPAAVVATCCGHVAAAEAKVLLREHADLPVVGLRGTRGGSAVAAAAVNACARLVAPPVGAPA